MDAAARLRFHCDGGAVRLGGPRPCGQTLAKRNLLFNSGSQCCGFLSRCKNIGTESACQACDFFVPGSIDVTANSRVRPMDQRGIQLVADSYSNRIQQLMFSDLKEASPAPVLPHVAVLPSHALKEGGRAGACANARPKAITET